MTNHQGTKYLSITNHQGTMDKQISILNNQLLNQTITSYSLVICPDISSGLKFGYWSLFSARGGSAFG